MTFKRGIPILAATAACTLGVAVPAASAATDVQQASSENWAGYVVGGSGSSNQQFKSVSGSWVQPTAKCTSGQGYSAFWIGLGGSGQSDSLEQDGTEADCSANGAPSYFAWYEMVPKAPVKVNMAIHPGDHMSSRVSVSGSNVSFWLADETTGATYSHTFQMSNPDTSSAEWIAEAPSQCSQGLSSCTPLSLADFGTVQFTNATATDTSGHTGTISDPNWSAAAVTLSPGASGTGFASYDPSAQGGSAGATPSSLSSGGSSFSVAWSPDGGSSTDTSGAAGSASARARAPRGGHSAFGGCSPAARGSAGSASAGSGYPGGGYSSSGGYPSGGGGYGDPGYGYGG